MEAKSFVAKNWYWIVFGVFAVGAITAAWNA